MSREAEMDARLFTLVSMTVRQSVASHHENEMHCRSKARKARLPNNIQDYTERADKYKRLVDANTLIIELLAERTYYGSESYHAHQASGGAAAMKSSPKIAPSTAPLVIPDHIHDLQIPDQYMCPITTQIMKDPVLLTDGHVYERAAITEWLKAHDTSPITKAVVCKNTIIPCFNLKSLIAEYVQLN